MFARIILSTFSGAGAVGSDQLLPFAGATTLVGIISLLVGILQTVQNFGEFALPANLGNLAQVKVAGASPEVVARPAVPLKIKIKSDRKLAVDV